MKIGKLLLGLGVLLTLGLALGSASARADYDQRFSLGVGFVTMSNPSQTNFEIGAEYEYRTDPLLGIGVSGNYIFSSPGTVLLAVPDLFFHPLAGEWLISAAPLLEFGQLTGTNIGARIGTRIPIPMGAVTLLPSVLLDFINGGRDWIFGVGIEF
jgi:hypothetical protein